MNYRMLVIATGHVMLAIMLRLLSRCLIAPAITLTLAGCATPPPSLPGQAHEIDSEQLTVDATTLEEVTHFMGPPLTTKTAPDGSIALGYTLHDQWNEGEILILFFTPEHILRGKATVSDEDDDRTDT